MMPSSRALETNTVCSTFTNVGGTRQSDYRALPVSLAGNGSFVNILGSIGAWVGSSTVQHMIGLSLTRPVLAVLGPIGFVGAFGIFQVGLKAAMNSAQLSAFGWSADQSPARGPRESLTVGVSESDQMHFGLNMDRQQVHIRSTSDVGWDVRKVKGQPAQRFSIVGANGRMKNTYVNSKFRFDTAIYHSNMTWLGRRKGCFVTCKDELAVRKQLIWYFLLVIFVGSMLVSSAIVAEIFMITGAVLVSDTQVAAYGATKLISLLLLHLKFFLASYPKMPGDACKDGKCIPARIRIYRQKRTTSGGENGTAFVYCERSYRVVQGIDHPSLASVNVLGSSYFIYGAEEKGEAGYYLKTRVISVKLIEWAAATFGLLFLFFYAWYVSWLVDNARSLENSSYKLYLWSAIEYILLGGKIILLATRSDNITIVHGKDINVKLCISKSTAHIGFTDDELLHGALVEASGKHIIKAHAQMAYQFQNKLCAIHLDRQSTWPSIGCLHVYQEKFGEGDDISIHVNTTEGVLVRKLRDPKGSQKASQFAIKRIGNALYLGIQGFPLDELDHVRLSESHRTPAAGENKPTDHEERIRTFSITLIEHQIATGKKVPAVAMHTELEELVAPKIDWFALNTKVAMHTIDEALYRMESINVPLMAALLTNRGVFGIINAEEHGMCPSECK